MPNFEILLSVDAFGKRVIGMSAADRNMREQALTWAKENGIAKFSPIDKYPVSQEVRVLWYLIQHNGAVNRQVGGTMRETLRRLERQGVIEFKGTRGYAADVWCIKYNMI